MCLASRTRQIGSARLGCAMRRWAWVVVVCAGCEDLEGVEPMTVPSPSPEVAAPERDEPPAEVEAPSACGETWHPNLEVVGQVFDADGAPVADADVWLELRNWGPLQVQGEGSTDDDGRFSFTAWEVPIVEGCWAIGPQFYLVAESGDVTGDQGVNMTLVRAWQDGTAADGIQVTIDEPVIELE